MEDCLSNIYRKFADKINTMIPVEWMNVYYLGEVKSRKMSWSSVFYFSLKEDGSFIKSHEIPSKYGISKNNYQNFLIELCDILLELYDLFDENEQTLWEQVLFSMNSSGKFSIDYKYNVFNDNSGGQVKRETIWAYETFGHKPKEGTYHWKLLQEYLQKETKPE